MEMAGYAKITTQNHQKQNNYKFFAYLNRASGLEKQIFSGKISDLKKLRKTMHKIHRQSE